MDGYSSWMEKPLPSMSKEGPHFSSFRTAGAADPTYLYAFDLLIRDGEALHTQRIERRREQLSELLPEPIEPIRFSPLLQAPVVQVLEGVRKLRLKALSASATVPNYEQVSDPALGSGVPAQSPGAVRCR